MPTKIGRYEVIATLGQGAMGTVYKAVDPLIERTVAIKTINLDLAQEERAEFEERFYREAKSAGRLNHANIVTIYDVGETEDIAYIAMEYLQGESLREMLDSGVVLPIETIVRIVSRIASALNYAHENEVVHRDIKPANIMITSNRDVKIMDFGIAQIPTGSRTQHGTVLGSPTYMAPEQVASEPIDGKTDIFALGVVLYEMLTGVTPFKGDNLSAIMFKILHMDPVPPSKVDLRVPPVFDRIIARALAKRPADRYASARDLARDLKSRDTIAPNEAARSASGRAARVPEPARVARPDKKPANPQDATLLLAPDKAQQLRAAASAGSSSALPSGQDASDQGAAWADNAAVRKWALFILPVVITLAFVAFSQSTKLLPGTSSGSRLASDAAEGGNPSPRIVADSKPDIIAPLLPPVAAPTSAPDEPRVEPSSAARESRELSGQTEAEQPAPPAVTRTATLTFAVSPWGEIFIDGKSAGVSPPLNRLELKTGRHRIEIRNQAFAAYRDTVTLDSGQSLKIRHKFK
ncbi:MAG: serine/threonine protein kinase [Thiobacillus sp.]|nr:serine/threonine protein kinase [Thiobacillus sp.]